MSVEFELFGVARLKAGTDRVSVTGATVGAALEDLERVCPALSGDVLRRGQLDPHFRLSLNGHRFISDPDLDLRAGDVLILLSAEAGG